MCGEAGIDIVAVARIDVLIRNSGATFLSRWFTSAEIEYCSRKAVPSRHFAARLAAKEAVAKILPGRWDGPLPWRAIEIVSSGTGAPAVKLSGEPMQIALRSGIGEIRISMSHCDDYATAMAISDHPARGRDTR